MLVVRYSKVELDLVEFTVSFSGGGVFIVSYCICTNPSHVQVNTMSNDRRAEVLFPGSWQLG